MKIIHIAIKMEMRRRKIRQTATIPMADIMNITMQDLTARAMLRGQCTISSTPKAAERVMLQNPPIWQNP